jgi:hypothetical protein
MSRLGQKQTPALQQAMSAYTNSDPKADVCFCFTPESGHVQCSSYVRFGSQADMCAATSYVR